MGGGGTRGEGTGTRGAWMWPESGADMPSCRFGACVGQAKEMAQKAGVSPEVVAEKQNTVRHHTDARGSAGEGEGGGPWLEPAAASRRGGADMSRASHRSAVGVCLPVWWVGDGSAGNCGRQRAVRQEGVGRAEGRVADGLLRLRVSSEVGRPGSPYSDHTAAMVTSSLAVWQPWSPRPALRHALMCFTGHHVHRLMSWLPCVMVWRRSS